MYLKLKGKKLPYNALGFATDETNRPRHLVPLGKSMWPKEQVARLITLFKNAGIPEPLTQKLVEPVAYYFGGVEKDGVPDVSGVNWEKMVDYFEWEIAAVLKDDRAKATALQEQAKKKWKHLFSHYAAWEDRSASYY